MNQLKVDLQQLATNSINKNEDENTPLKPPSKTSIRHVVLRKSSPADQKQLTRTLSSKSIKTVSKLKKFKAFDHVIFFLEIFICVSFI